MGKKSGEKYQSHTYISIVLYLKYKRKQERQLLGRINENQLMECISSHKDVIILM